MNCSLAARLFFIGLWNFADDDGVFEWQTKSIKAKIFPCDNISVEKLFSELLQNNLVAKFAINTREYGKIITFSKHQKIDVRFRRSILTNEQLTDIKLNYDVSTSGTPREHVAGREVEGKGGGREVEVAIAPTPAQQVQSFLNDTSVQETIIQKIVASGGWQEESLRSEVKKFCAYWVERTGDGKKQRWQLEKTFEVRRRLTTWLGNSPKFSPQSHAR